MHRDLSQTKVELYPYRRATVGERFLELPRELAADLEKALAEKVGHVPDNHTVYALTQTGLCDPHTTYLWFTDSVVMFGNKIIKN
jgi:hypothetical protein